MLHRRAWMLLLSVMVGALLLAVACNESLVGVGGSGRIVTEERDIQPFTEMSVSHGIRAILSIEPGAEPSLVLHYDDNLLPLLRTHVEDGRLILDATDSIRRSSSARIEITTDRLDRIAVSGGADVEVSGFRGSSLVIDAGGGADLHVDGQVGRLVVAAGGGADLDLSGLLADEVEVEAGGGADVSVHARQNVSAEATGGADITVYGEPPRVNMERSGGGEVHLR